MHVSIHTCINYSPSYSQVDSGGKRNIKYTQGFFADYDTLICLVSESDGCHPGTLEQFFYSHLKSATHGQIWAILIMGVGEHYCE